MWLPSIQPPYTYRIGIQLYRSRSGCTDMNQTNRQHIILDTWLIHTAQYYCTYIPSTTVYIPQISCPGYRYRSNRSSSCKQGHVLIPFLSMQTTGRAQQPQTLALPAWKLASYHAVFLHAFSTCNKTFVHMRHLGSEGSRPSSLVTSI